MHLGGRSKYAPRTLRQSGVIARSLRFAGVVGLICAGACDKAHSDDVPRMCGEEISNPPRSPEFRSNTPWAEFSATRTEEASGLTLISSNFVQDETDPGSLRWWFGEIRNDGPVAVCFPKAGLLFFSAERDVLAAVDLFFESDPFEGPSGSAIPCLEPGGYAIGSTNTADPWSESLDLVATVEISFDASIYNGVVPHPLAPAISQLDPVPGEYGGVDLAGTVCNAESDLHFFWLYAYAIDEEGLVTYRFDDFVDGTFAEGDAWEFSISSYGDAAMPAQTVAFVDFDVGPEEQQLDDGGPSFRAAARVQQDLANYRAHLQRIRHRS